MPIESQGQSLGSKAPGFSLESVDSKRYTLDSFEDSKALLVAFICNHCPYVMAVEDRLIALSRSYPKDQFQIVGICSNDATNYPEDEKTQLFARWKAKQYGFVYLVDEMQDVAKAYGAVCTPDLFLYDQKRTLYYHGRLDDNWKTPALVSQHELKNAIDALLRGQEPPSVQHPTVGCSIKWKQAQ